MAAAAKLSSEARESIEAWRETQHTTLTFEGKVYSRGDDIYVNLPQSDQGMKATFLTYVTPIKGKPYVEVETRKGVNRVVRPEDIIRGGKKI